MERSKLANILRIAAVIWVVTVAITCSREIGPHRYPSISYPGLSAQDYKSAEKYDRDDIIPYEDDLKWTSMVRRTQSTGATSADIEWCTKRILAPNNAVWHAFLTSVLQNTRVASATDRTNLKNATAACLRRKERLERKAACLIIIFNAFDRDKELLHDLTPLTSDSDESIREFAKRAVQVIEAQ